VDDSRPDEQVETAEFAPARVGGRRSRRLGPVVAGVWIVALVAVVGVGIASHAVSDPEGSGAASQLPAALQPLPSTAAQASALLASRGPSRPGDVNLIAIEVAPLGAAIAVRGRVRSRSVVSVLVSVERSDGSVSWRSLSILDGGLQAVNGPSFVFQFDRAKPVPGDVVWVEANAYNDLGRKIGSVRRSVGQAMAHDPIRTRTQMLK
jgi:hypothetical protein